MIKNQNFGVEIELTGITRQQAARRFMRLKQAGLRNPFGIHLESTWNPFGILT